MRDGRFDTGRVRDEVQGIEAGTEAKAVFEEVALADHFVEFLTLPAYALLD